MKTITLSRTRIAYNLYHSNFNNCFYAFIGQNFGTVQASILRACPDPSGEYFYYGMDYQGECDLDKPINVTCKEWL